MKNHIQSKIQTKFIKSKKESIVSININKKKHSTRNRVFSNLDITLNNKTYSNIDIPPIHLTNKKESKYKGIFKQNGNLTVNRTKNMNSMKNIRENNVRNSFNKKQSIKDYKKILGKLRLFKDNENDSNTVDIKSYETTLEMPSISETQEKKLSLLTSSLLILTQNDELLYNNINYDEKLESSIEFIIEYLSIKDLFNLSLINKEFHKIIIKYLLEKAEIKLQKIKEKINQIIIDSKGFINTKEKEFKIFEKTIFDERAMNLINSISKKKLFKEKSSLMNNKDIILLFELFFISIGKKYDIIQFDTNDTETKIKRWSYFCKYFTDNETEHLKNIIEKAIVNGKFSDEIINSLYDWSFKNIDKIKPNHFQIINKDISIFAYIIKDLLDYFGINKENKVSTQKLYTLNSIRLNVNKKLVSKLNQMLIKYD